MPCRVTRNSRGIAYVQFVKPRDAVAAQAALDSSSFQGRLLHVLPASQRPEAPKPELEVRASHPMAANDMVPKLQGNNCLLQGCGDTAKVSASRPLNPPQQMTFIGLALGTVHLPTRQEDWCLLTAAAQGLPKPITQVCREHSHLGLTGSTTPT